MVMKKIALPVILCSLISSAPFALLADTPKPTRSVEGLAGQNNNDVTITTKTRYIDEMEVMQKTKKGMKVAEEISEKRRMWGEEINQKGNEMQRRMADYQNKRSTMGDAARAKEEKELARAERDYKALAEERDQDFKVAMEQATQDLFKEVEEVVRAMAMKENLDAVIGRTTGRVLYVSTKADYTDKIIVAMDEKYPEAPTMPGQQMKPTMVS